MSAVQIFSLPQVVMLCTGIGATTLNFPLNRTDFKLFQGLDNPIQILIRDVDRAPVTFATGVTPIVNIFQKRTSKLIFTSPLTLVDATQSLWTFTVAATDIDDWSVGPCTYTIITVDSTGTRLALYMNRGYGLVGDVEVIEGPYPPTVSAEALPASSFLTVDGALVGGYIPGAAQVGNLSGLHTAAIYGTGMTGTVEVQALLDTDVSTTANQWLSITTATITDLTGIQPLSFEGNYYWIRYVVQTTEGTFDQILSRS